MARADVKHGNIDHVLSDKKHELTLKGYSKIREASKNYNREIDTEGVLYYINNCIFNEYGELIQEPSIPENTDINFENGFNRAKKVSGYAFVDGINASKSEDLVIPDKYKTTEQIIYRKFFDAGYNYGLSHKNTKTR